MRTGSTRISSLFFIHTNTGGGVSPHDSVPQAVACLGVEAFELVEDLVHGGATGGLLVGTGCLLPEEAQLGCLGLNVGLADEAEGTDNGDGVVLEGEAGLHGLAVALVGDVHEEGGEDVVHVVAEGYLVEALTDGKGEEGLATIPGAEEAAGLALVGTLVEGAVQDVQPDAGLVAELLQIASVGLVGYVVHDDVGGLDLYLRTVDARAGCQQPE